MAVKRIFGKKTGNTKPRFDTSFNFGAGSTKRSANVTRTGGSYLRGKGKGR